MRASRRASWGLFLLGVLAAPAWGGVIYRFTESGEYLKSWHRSGRVEMEGAGFRVEYVHDEEEYLPYDILLSRDNGGHITAVNVVDGTYFDLEEFPRGVLGRANPPAQPRPPNWKATPGTVEHIEADLSKVGPGPAIAGHPSEEFALTARYQVESLIGKEKVRQLVQIEVRLWTAADLSRQHLPIDPMEVGLGYGYPEVDHAVAQKLAAIDHQVLRLHRKTVMGYEGNPPLESSASLQIDSWDSAEVEPGRFETPPGLRHQAPVLSWGAGQASHP